MTHQRSIRRIALAASTALASGLFLAATPAFAQLGPVPDAGHLTTTTAGLSGGAPGSTNPIVSTTGAAGAQTMQIDLRDNRSILTWRGTGFNIAEGNTVNFKDARATSGVTGRTDNIAVLNRDLTFRSYIGGTLKSDPNVAVYIINQQGVMFGAGGSIDTGSFFASASDLSNDNDFLNGSNTLRFSQYAGGDVGTNPGTRFKTTASSSSDGGKMGDFVLIGSRINFNGFDGSYTTGDIGGDAGLIVASDVTVISTPGSPLSFAINKGSIQDSYLSSNLIVGGKLTARNITVALTSTGAAVRDPINMRPEIQLTGSLIATGAAVTDHGVVLTSGRAAPGVAIAGIRSTATTADIFAGGHLRQTETGVIKSASGAWVAADSHIMYGSLEADGAVGIDATLTWLGALVREPYGTITGGSVTLYSDALFKGKITATNGDIIADVAGKSLSFGDLQASGNIKLTGTTLNITDGGFVAGGAIDINTTGAIDIVGSGLIPGLGNAQGASVSIISDSDIRMGKIDGTIGDVTLQAGRFLTAGNVTSAGAFIGRGGSDITLGDLTSAGNATLITNAANGRVTLNAAHATGANADLFIETETLQLPQAPLLVPLSAGRDITITLNGAGSLTGTGITAGRNLNIAARFVELASAEGTHGYVNITANGTPANGTGVANIGKIVAGTDVIVAGDLVSITEATAIGSLSLTSNSLTQVGSGVALSSITTGGSLTIAAGGSALIRGNVTVGGDFNVTGTNVVMGNSIPGAQMKARGAVNLVATTGSVQALGNTLLQGNSDGVGDEAVTVSAATGVTFDAETALLGGTARQSDIRIRTSGSHAISLGALTGRRLLGAIGSAAFTTGLSTSSDIAAIGAISLTDTLKLNSRNVRTGQVTASNIDIISSQRVEGASFTAIGTIDVRAEDSIMLSDVLAPGGITLTAPGTLSRNGYIQFSSAKALGSDADVIIAAGRSVTSLGINAPVQAGRDVLIRGGTAGALSPGELGVNLGSIQAGRNLTITAPGIATTFIDATTGFVSLIGTGGSLRTLSIEAGGSITGNGTSVRVSQAIAPNAAVMLTADSGDLDLGETGGTSFAGGNMTLTANGGAVRVGGTLTSYRNLNIAGNSVNITGYLSRPLNIRARGAVTIDGRTGNIFVNGNGGLIQSNSDGIGEEALTLQTGGGIGSLGADLLGGTLRQSDVRLRHGANQFVQLTGVSARSLLGASGSNPFTNGLNTTSSIVIAGQVDLVNSLSLTGSQVGVKAINIRNGDVNIRATGDNLELSAPIVASGDIFLDAGTRGLLIDGGGSLSGRNVVLSMGDAFVNLRGSDAITASGHWVVYSQSPSFEPVYETMVEFGGLDSGATALWGATYATRAPSTISGNRYVFAIQPTLTFSTADLSKIYGTDLTGSASLPFGVAGYQPGVAGAFLADTAATAYAGLPSIISAGFAARARVAGGPYTTSIAQGSLTSDAGYAFAFSSPGMVTITPKALTGTIAIDTKTYDGTTAATGTVGLAGVVAGDTVSTTGSVFAFLDKNAAAGKTVTVTGTALNGIDSGNYTLTIPASALGNILKRALTGTITVNNKTYVGTTGSVFTFADKNAGTSKTVTVSGTALNGTDAGNYTLTLPASALADILKKALTGTITVNSKTYDGTTAATGSVGLSGVISGESVGTTGSVFTFADKNAGTGKTVTVGGTSLNGADAGNYTLTLPASALADILQKALTGTITVNNKTYDGTTTATGSVGLSGAISGDSVGTTGSVFTFADKNAGAGKTVAVTGTVLNGTDAGNYTLTLPANALADILKKALTGSITVNSKTYDGTTAATGSVGLSGAISGDSIGTTGSVFTFADKNAGTGKTVNVGGTALNGADAGNYTLSIPATALADILKKALTGTVTVNNKTYDGTTATSGSMTLSGVLAGDSVGTTGSVFSFADKNAGTGKAVTVSGTTLNGADGGNYTLTLPASALADILKRALTVSADDLEKREGTADPILTFTVTNGSLVAGDSLGGAVVRGPGEDVGDYAITQGTLSGGQNYDLTFHDGVFTITERPASETPIQPLRNVVLPAQLPDLTPSSAPVSIDDSAVCGNDPACVTSN